MNIIKKYIEKRKESEMLSNMHIAFINDTKPRVNLLKCYYIEDVLLGNTTYDRQAIKIIERYFPSAKAIYLNVYQGFCSEVKSDKDKLIYISKALEKKILKELLEIQDIKDFYSTQIKLKNKNEILTLDI
jgi:hypothetical protein